MLEFYYIKLCNAKYLHVFNLRNIYVNGTYYFIILTIPISQMIFKQTPF